MKTETFTGATREEAEGKVNGWRLSHPGIVEKPYLLTEGGSPAGRFAPKTSATDKFVSIAISYEDLD